MPKTESNFPVRTKSFSFLKIVTGIVIAFVSVYLLWLLPTTRQAVIFLLGSPAKITLPTLTAPNTIKPETAKDVRLLEHWGNGKFIRTAWSPDGRYFVIGTTFGLNLYDGETFQLLRYIRLPIQDIGWLTFSPENGLLAAASAQGNILLIDLADDKILQQWELDKSIIELIYLKDGTLVCVADPQSGGAGHEIFKLVQDRWQPVKTLDAGYLVEVTFVPEMQAFAAHYSDSVRLIDPVSGVENMLPYNEPYGGMFILTKDIFLTVDTDRYLFSAYRNGELLKTVGLDSMISDPMVSPAGGLLATIERDPGDGAGEKVLFWKIPELKPTRSIRVTEASLYFSTSIDFSPSGDRLAVLVSPSTVKIYPTSGDDQREITISDLFAGIADIAITPAGEIRAVWCSGTALKILKLPSATPIEEWKYDASASPDPPDSCQLLGDSETVVVDTAYEGSRFYKAGEVDARVNFKSHCSGIYSADGSVCTSSGGVGSSGDPVTVSIWYKKSGLTEKWGFLHDGHEEFNMAVSANGQYVAGTSRSNTYLWVNGIETGRRYPALLSRITFSPDNTYLASMNGILELASGHFTKIASVQDGYPRYDMPAFSPDGQILAGDMGGTLHFWQVNNGTVLAELDNPDFTDPGMAYALDQKLVFSPDGTILVGVGDGVINVWGIPGNPR